MAKRHVARRTSSPTPSSTGWDHVAAWYDKLVGDEGSDYHRHVILPAALRMLNPQRGERFLDLGCGQGVVARALLEHQVEHVVGLDASAKLIAAAKARGPRDPRLRYHVGDARRLGALADGSFDGVACIMAVQDLDDLEALCAGMAGALKPGGRAVVILMHPCFRIPRQSSWEWDEKKATRYRRLDRYATRMTIPISTHPGSDPGSHTTFYHRPLADYLNALGRAGLATIGCEELLTHRKVQAGGRSRGENRAAAEFPVFLALKAVRTSA